MTNFHPNHLIDLRKSGLSDETIEQSGIKTVPSGQINKRLGFNLPGLTSCYEIPYPGCKDFSRLRCFYEDGKNGPRYLQCRKSGNHLYIPNLAASILSDPTKPLYLTEGEKKAIKASQEGLPCIGLSGLWNWKLKDGELIPDFDKIELKHRTVYIVPDNDWRSPNKHGYEKNLEQAVHLLAKALQDRGAVVKIVILPEGPEKGLDDYLLSHTVDDFLSLPCEEVRKLTFEEMIEATTIDNLDEVLKRVAQEPSRVKQEALVKTLSEKLRISTRAIMADIKTIQVQDRKTTVECGIYIAHPSLEVSERFLSLGFREKIVEAGEPKDRSFYVTSCGGRITRWDEPLIVLSNEKILFENRGRVLVNLTDRWSFEDLNSFISAPASKPVYGKVRDILTEYAEFQHPAYYGLLAAWIIGTYYHRLFNAYPFLFLLGKKQTGKSRVLDLIERIAFNAMKTKGISVAALADSLDGVRGTLCVDQAEILKDKTHLELLGILADSYTIGGGKRRIVNITPRGRGILEFETFGPKAFASTRELDADLLDRCILIPMLRARQEYPYPDAFLKVWAETRCLLYRRVLTNWQEVKSIYHEAAQNMKHRLRELWRPLETILTVERVGDIEQAQIQEAFLKAMAETQDELDEREELLFETLFKLTEGKETALLTAKEVGEVMADEDGIFKNDRAKTTWIGKSFSRLSLYDKKLPPDRGKHGVHPYLFTRDRIKEIYMRYKASSVSGEVVQTQAEQAITGSPPFEAHHIEVVQAIKSTDGITFPTLNLTPPSSHCEKPEGDVVKEKAQLSQGVHHIHHMHHLLKEDDLREGII